MARWIPALVALLALQGCVRELRLPDVRQATPYTCGAAALLSVLAYFGQEAREDTLAEALGTTPEDGAPPDAIVRVATAHGLAVRAKEGWSLAELADAMRRGRPVLVALQAWPDRGRASFADDWDDGHYVVVVAVERRVVVFEDPSILGGRGVLTHAAFLDRRHDRDGARSYVHLGIEFGGRPAPPRARQTIE
jgi:predicted double-glycine peptidase